MSFHFDDRCTPITLDREDFDNLLENFEHHFDGDLCIFETDTLPFMQVCILPTDWDEYSLGYTTSKGRYEIYNSLESINELYNMNELSSMLGDVFNMPKNPFVKYLKDRRKKLLDWYKKENKKISNDDLRYELITTIKDEEFDWKDGMLDTDLQDIVYDFYAKKSEEFISKKLGY